MFIMKDPMVKDRRYQLSVNKRKRLLNFYQILKYNYQKEKKNKVIPILLKDFRFNYLKYSESVHSENTTKVFKVTFYFLLKHFGNIYLKDGEVMAEHAGRKSYDEAFNYVLMVFNTFYIRLR